MPAHAMMARLGDAPEDKELKTSIIELARRYQLEDISHMLEGRRLTDFLPWNRK